MRDAELESRIRAADPARTPAGSPIDARAESDLARILGINRARVSGHRRRWLIIPIVVVAVVAVVVTTQDILPISKHATERAQAATPPLLAPYAAAPAFEDAVRTAITQLELAPASAPQRTSSSQAWFVNTDYSGDGATYSYVSPQEVASRWSPDKSGEILVVAGKPFRADGANVTIAVDPTPEGTVLQHDIFKPGEMGVEYPSVPPSDPDLMLEYLSANGFVTDRSDAVQLLDEVTELQDEWTLSGGQEAAILAMLSQLGVLRPVGVVTDRLGRPGVAYSATSPNNQHFRDVLVISQLSGRILSIEKVYQGGLAELPLRPPAVTSYIAWK